MLVAIIQLFLFVLIASQFFKHHVLSLFLFFFVYHIKPFFPLYDDVIVNQVQHLKIDIYDHVNYF